MVFGRRRSTLKTKRQGFVKRELNLAELQFQVAHSIWFGRPLHERSMSLVIDATNVTTLFDNCTCGRVFSLKSLFNALGRMPQGADSGFLSIWRTRSTLAYGVTVILRVTEVLDAPVGTKSSVAITVNVRVAVLMAVPELLNFTDRKTSR